MTSVKHQSDTARCRPKNHSLRRAFFVLFLSGLFFLGTAWIVADSFLLLLPEFFPTLPVTLTLACLL